MSSDSINAKKEFKDVTKGYVVIAAHIHFGYEEDDEQNTFNLKPLYSKDDYKYFLAFLDRNYDSGFGGQELYGIIYCENNVWMDRGEYDGSEWWNINEYPSMSQHFSESDILKYERSKKIKNIEK